MIKKTLILTLTVMLVAVCSSYAANSPKDRLDYWQSNYAELSTEDDPRAARAHEIFKRVLSAAGKRPGVVPRLYIIKSTAPYIPLAFAIPDGGIVISRKVLDICYKDTENGDDRLAFILAHEIAHQLKEDFWHMKFFQAVELSREGGVAEDAVLEEVRSIASLTDQVLSKELQADEHGIIYAAMAGFDTEAIVTGENNVNFFEYFYESLDPGKVKGVKKDPSHPTPQQRAASVRARLKQVIENVELFDIGLLFYQAGKYEKAILFFEEFLRHFPGREVYHNLAASHHQLALKNYRKWKGQDPAFPFKLSLVVDPETRAKNLTLRGIGLTSPEELFKQHLGKAIEHYRTAIDQDPTYLPSYINLACALIVNDEIYEAVAMLKKAAKIDPDNVEALNNLGVAYFLVDNPQKAEESLLRATALAPDYDPPLFNLGKIAHLQNEEAEAKKLWTAYLKLDGSSPWADSIRAALSMGDRPSAPENTVAKVKEKLLGIKVGNYVDDLPEGWGKPVEARKMPLQEEPFLLTTYENGAKIVSQEEKSLLVLSASVGNGKSSRGISVGDNEKTVIAAYGIPLKTLETTKGSVLVYEEAGIAFHIVDGKVRSWLLF